MTPLSLSTFVERWYEIYNGAESVLLGCKCSAFGSMLALARQPLQELP